MQCFTGPAKGFACVAGDASESPYASTMRPPVILSNARRTSFGRGAAPETQARIEPRSYFESLGWRRIAMYIVGTPGKIVGRPSGSAAGWRQSLAGLDAG